MENKRKTTLMQLQPPLPVKIAVTVGLMLLLIVFVYCCKIPNPNMILIAGLVLCSALFGFSGGITAAIIMLGYTLFFFSTDHSFTRFTAENAQKVVVSLIGVSLDMLLVCLLKREELRAFRQVDALTEELHRENALLQRMSLTDSLTGIRNRAALWQDSQSFPGRMLTVMMLDLNNFKHINDSRGHEEGDRILSEMGRLLAESFGQQHCYRYGGDEFLVIVPDLPEAEFQSRIEALRQKNPARDRALHASFSVGCVHAELKQPDELQALIARADAKMYEAKRQSRA